MSRGLHLVESGSNDVEAVYGGERARFLEAVALFETMHRALVDRVEATPERRALAQLDETVRLVAPKGRNAAALGLDLTALSAFRASVEALADRTPEAKALALFEGALQAMFAAAPDFDDIDDIDDIDAPTVDADGSDASEIGPESDEADEARDAAEEAVDPTPGPTSEPSLEDGDDADDEDRSDDEAADETDARPMDDVPADEASAETVEAASEATTDAEAHEPDDRDARIAELEAELARMREGVSGLAA